MTLLIFSLLGGGCVHGRRNKKGYRTVKGKVLNDDKTVTAIYVQEMLQTVLNESETMMHIYLSGLLQGE